MDDVSKVELASKEAEWIYEEKEHKARRLRFLLTRHSGGKTKEAFEDLQWQQ